MANKILIVISGPPCTGKTTLGKKISMRFDLPLLSKDAIKETLFDTLGVKDREWSKLLGVVSYKLLYQFLEAFLKTGNPVIIESNFQVDYDAGQLNHLINRYGYTPLQIQCKTEGQVLFERFKQRSESSNRHPGHVDNLNYGEFKESLLKGAYEPLEINGDIIILDTTDFNKVGYGGLYRNIRRLIESSAN